MTTWIITNQHKKNAVEKQFWYKDGKTVIKEEGFRWGRWSCESDEVPEIDLENPDGYEVGFTDYEWEMDEMVDGCWVEWTFPDDMSDEEREEIENAWNEEFYEGLEELGWSNDDTEYWIYGPLMIEDDQGNVVAQGIED
jgi:hypothetical protein